tara:strand:- start:587 stop:1396 length:810 start_codon:yes stop_codon:yes gene_type:complete
MGFKSTNKNELIQSKIEQNDEEIIESETTEPNQSDDNEEEIEEKIEEIKPIVKNKVKKKVAKKGKIITTDNGEKLQVIIKKKPKKPKIIYLSDSEDEEEIIQVAPKPKSRGRPRKSSITQVVEYVDKDGNKVDNRKKAKQTIINHDIKDKPLTASEIKLIELEQKLAELSAVSGKTILSTKKGKPDKRQVKQPTEKQLAARKAFLENNKIRNLKKKEQKEAKKKNESKDNVKEVLNELSNIKKQKIQQLEQKKEEVKIENKILIDNLFD